MRQASGVSLNEFLAKLVPHHGHSLIGSGGSLELSLAKLSVLARAVCLPDSWALPIWFGVAARPTQSAISNGHSPSSFVAFSRSSSRAQINAAARPS